MEEGDKENILSPEEADTPNIAVNELAEEDLTKTKSFSPALFSKHTVAPGGKVVFNELPKLQQQMRHLEI